MFSCDKVTRRDRMRTRCPTSHDAPKRAWQVEDQAREMTRLEAMLCWFGNGNAMELTLVDVRGVCLLAGLGALLLLARRGSLLAGLGLSRGPRDGQYKTSMSSQNIGLRPAWCELSVGRKYLLGSSRRLGGGRLLVGGLGRHFEDVCGWVGKREGWMD